MILSFIFRNIIRNRKNSLVIVLLITSICFLFFLGNSLVGRSDRGMRAAYVDSLTGDLVIQKKGPVTMNMFGANTPVIDEYFKIPELPAYDMVREIAASQAGVEHFTSQVSTKAYLDMLGVREPVLLCGVDVATYFNAFPGIELVEGRFLEEGEYGAMITLARAESLERRGEAFPRIGTPLLFTAAGEMGFKIREVPLVGIYRYRNPGQYMNELVITDPQTARVLSAIQVAGVEAEPAGAFRDLSVPLDDLFAEGVFAEDQDVLSEQEAFSVESLEALLTSAVDEGGEIMGGGWNFIILRLEKGTSAVALASSLNRKFASFDVVAVDWRIAAGNSAILLFLIQFLLNSGVFLVSVTGIIAAVNILLISLFKRTREIGTLRAIGAGDGYIRFLILGENLVLAAGAGVLGLILGYCFIRLINGALIVIPNDLIASLLGGPVLRLSFIPSVALSSFAAALVLGLVTALLPVETAVRIDPMVAVRRG
ncbi:MAG: ABC transporter permease [Treponema sp.]|jgi:ABC-type antimicrobial peptide transport system permease subunit|nr:ABC transporter permease [Treponema sp.]